MPAIILECGFMDSATDVPIILTEEFAEGCATAIVEVLVKRGKLTKKPVTITKTLTPEELLADLKAQGYEIKITKTVKS